MEVVPAELNQEERETVARHFSESSKVEFLLDIIVLLCDCYLSQVRDLVRTSPPTLTFPRTFLTQLWRVREVKVREDDIWVVTPPKCGTTWLQDLTWLITNNADTDKVCYENSDDDMSLFEFIY